MLDWDDLRFFLAIARLGSLSAAAKELHVAQSTVGRRLASLEAGLGARLLNRTPDGYVATLAGPDVREKTERLEAEAHSLERDVGGRDTRVAGLVRVTCAESVACHILAPCLASQDAQHPDIMVELPAASVFRCVGQKFRYNSHDPISTTSSYGASGPWLSAYTPTLRIWRNTASWTLKGLPRSPADHATR